MHGHNYLSHFDTIFVPLPCVTYNEKKKSIHGIVNLILQPKAEEW